ncbi:MAG: hypothetical protein ACOCQE_04770 [Halanaerobium sp.]
METKKIEDQKYLREDTFYRLSFINREMIDITVNVEGRLRNALSDLNKEITITDYFVDKDSGTGEYFVYFRTMELPDQKSFDDVINYIIAKSNMAAVDLKYNFREEIITDPEEVEKEKDKNYIDDFKDDIDDLFEGKDDQVKNILLLVIVIYALSIVKDFTD